MNTLLTVTLALSLLGAPATDDAKPTPETTPTKEGAEAKPTKEDAEGEPAQGGAEPTKEGAGGEPAQGGAEPAKEGARGEPTKEGAGGEPAQGGARSTVGVVPPKLIGELPVIDGLPTDQGTRRIVVQITIGIDGTVRDVVVAEGAGEPWDSAVVTGAATLRFEPATRDGAPIAVRVALPYTVGTPEPEPEPEPEVPTTAIQGLLLEKGTRKPLAGITVLVEGTELQAISDADGRFVIEAVTEGKVWLVVPGYDYLEARIRVTVPGDEVTVRLQPKSTARYRTVARGRTADASRILIPVEQAREVAGTSGDPLKVLEALPGVARPSSAGPGAGALIIRGSAPEDTKFYIDGMPLFQVYHFANLYSVLQDEWIRDIDYRAGGFSVEFGNATGGFLGVTLSDLKTDGVHGHIDVNVFHTAVLLTAPVSEHWSVGGAFRRSYIDAILPAVIPEDSGFGFGVAPRYYDYQARADYVPNERFNLRLLAFGSDDLFSFVFEEPPDQDPSFDGFSFGRAFHQVQATLNYIIDEETDLFAGLMSGWQNIDIRPGGAGIEISFCPLTLRSHVTWRGVDKLTLRSGVLATLQRYAVDVNIPAPTKEGQVQLPLASQELIQATEIGYSGEVALWAEAMWRPTSTLNVVGGVRINGWLGTFNSLGVDPRLTVNWDVTEGTQLTLAGGLNHQAPFPDETSESVGSPDLGPERGAYVSLGYRQDILDVLSLDIQGFYKRLFGLVSPTGASFGSDEPRYNNEGVGYVVGGEFLARWNMDWFDGWVSYSLSTSQRTDQPGEEERPFSYDQTHVLAVVAGVKLPRGWRIGGRFRYATGNPYTPLEPGYYDSTADIYVPKPAGPTLSGRLDDFIQVDLRVGKTFTFESWTLKMYLEVQNATNQENVEFINYSYDYRVPEPVNGLPIIPSIGIRGSF